MVISHNHYDHLDVGTVRKLARRAGGSPRFFVPLGLKRWFENEGITDVAEMDWWESLQFGRLRFTFTPVQHWSARGLFDRNRSLWGGWRIDTAGYSAFFAGDTGYSPDFAEPRRRLGPVDLAMLPIGAYEPRWFMKVMHVNPEEAVRIRQALGARHSVAMHWGHLRADRRAAGRTAEAPRVGVASGGSRRGALLAVPARRDPAPAITGPRRHAAR